MITKAKIPIAHKPAIDLMRDYIQHQQDENIAKFILLANDCGIKVDSYEYNTLWDYIYNHGSNFVEFV